MGVWLASVPATIVTPAWCMRRTLSTAFRNAASARTPKRAQAMVRIMISAGDATVWLSTIRRKVVSSSGRSRGAWGEDVNLGVEGSVECGGGDHVGHGQQASSVGAVD